MVFVWDDTYSVRIAEIDTQHQHLISLMNRLHRAISDGKGHAVIGDVLKELTAYAALHFSTEEGYFERYAYPGAAEHIQTHRRFMEQVDAYGRRLMKDRSVVALETLEFLMGWLSEHIIVDDKRFVAHVDRHAVR